MRAGVRERGREGGRAGPGQSENERERERERGHGERIVDSETHEPQKAVDV
jgi:hypothetical protein